MIISKFVNNYYNVLSFMYDNQVVVGDENLIPFTQGEIAELTNLNKVTVNKFFKEYIEDGLIYKKSNKYYLSKFAMSVVKKIKTIKDWFF